MFRFFVLLQLLVLSLSAEQTCIQLAPDTRNVTEIMLLLGFVVKKEPVIVEAGAYNGEHTAMFARWWPKAKIYAFEPIPELCDEVKRKTAKCPNVFCFPIALSDQTGKANFHVAGWTSGTNQEWTEAATVNGVSPTWAHNAPSSSLLAPTNHLEFSPHISFDRTIEVPTTTLDDWAEKAGVSQIDLIWLDMQGSELNMLKASKIAKRAKAIYIEVEMVELYEGQCLWKDVKAWMEESGFTLFAVDFDLVDLPVCGNALFIASNNPHR